MTSPVMQNQTSKLWLLKEKIRLLMARVACARWLLGWSNAYIWSQWSSEPFTHYCKLSRFIANKTFLLCTIDKFWLYPKFLVIAFWPCRHWGRKNLEWWILIFWYLDQIRVPSPSPLHFLYISGAFVALVVLSLTVTKFLFISIFFFNFLFLFQSPPLSHWASRSIYFLIPALLVLSLFSSLFLPTMGTRAVNKVQKVTSFHIRCFMASN